MMTCRLAAFGLALFGIGLGAGCAGKGRRPQAGPAVHDSGDMPKWVKHVDFEDGKLCGVGVAGAGYDEFSPYPKELSQERAVRNLAGILGTAVQEAIIDKQTENNYDIETVRAIQIDEDLIEKIAQIVETEYWLDRQGAGPFAQKNFMYAYSCMDASQAAALKFDISKIRKGAGGTVEPETVPSWISDFGRKPDGRLCTVGFSLPMFHADKTFESVVEDVRGQLATVIETLVSSYSEELTTNRYTAYEQMTVATTQALAEGVIVTDFWYDRDGRGPFQKARTTYGFGCVYPMDVIKSSLAALEKAVPEEEKNTVAKVKERAAHAFEDLDAEIAKREAAAAGGAAPTPSPRASDVPSADGPSSGDSGAQAAGTP